MAILICLSMTRTSFFISFFFFFTDPATTEIYTLSLHDALPISCALARALLAASEPDEARAVAEVAVRAAYARSEEHTSELQSLRHLVCRLLLEKKKKLEGKYPTYRAC